MALDLILKKLLLLYMLVKTKYLLMNSMKNLLIMRVFLRERQKNLKNQLLQPAMQINLVKMMEKEKNQNKQGNEKNPNKGYQNQPGHPSANSHKNNQNPKPYKGFCQLCDQQGHTAKRCPNFHYAPNFRYASSPWMPSVPPQSYYPRFVQSLCVHFAAQLGSATNWLVDSGAFDHVTVDLKNISLHSEYDGSEDIMIGDGTELSITHTGSTTLPSLSKSSTTLPSPSKSFVLSDVLCVPSMKKKNLLSVFKVCNSHNVFIKFLPSSFV